MSDSNYLLPEAYLRIKDSRWPEGDGSDCRPADGVSRVGQWSVEREIVGNTLPGQVRARSGLSVGSASARIPQTAEPMTPWSTRPSARVTPLEDVELYLAEEHDSPERQPLGDWVINPISGALSTSEVELDLVEASSLGKKPEHRLPPIQYLYGAWALQDASWVVAELASEMGYGDSPRPSNPLIYVPYTGSTMPVKGALVNIQYQDQSGEWLPWFPDDPVQYLYDNSPGSYGLRPVLNGVKSGGLFTYAREDVHSDVSGGTGTLSFSLTHNGVVRLLLGQPWDLAGLNYYPPQVEISPNGTFKVWNNNRPAATPTSGTYQRGSTYGLENRVEVQVQRLITDPEEGYYDQTRARIRSGKDAPWSSWVTNSDPHPAMLPEYAEQILPNAFYISVGLDVGSSSVSSFGVTLQPDSGTWTMPEKGLDIESLGSAVVLPYLDGHTSPWDGIQEVCGATLGAAWLDWEGNLKVRNSAYLAGRGNPSQVIDVEKRLDDIKWVTDPSEVVDRLQVTYYPPDVEQWRHGPGGGVVNPTAWQAEEAYEIGPGETVEVIGYTATPLTTITRSSYSSVVEADGLWIRWHPVWETDPFDPKSVPTWSAQTSRQGNGIVMGSDVLSVRSRALSHSRLLIQITNNTNQTLYTVDGNGNPHLIYRQSQVMFQENTAVVIRGVKEEDKAANPLQIDLTRMMQTKESAEAIANHIWQRVSGVRWRAESVRVALDWSLDIGDIIRLSHSQTGLDQKALVTRVALEGSPGEIAQTLDLVLLNQMWADFDRNWQIHTWDDFDAAWAGRTWEDFDHNPSRTHLY